MPDLSTATGTADYLLSNIRFEPETGGYFTIWFDLSGPGFAEPEAMKNIFVEFESFLLFLREEQPVLSEILEEGSPQAEDRIDRLDAAGFDWDANLRVYLSRQVDLVALEKERLGWLIARRARAAATDTNTALESAWSQLSEQAEPNLRPTWDDVMHTLVDRLNSTAVELYPEVLEFSAENNARLREMFEAHGERLANQLVALTDAVRKETN